MGQRSSGGANDVYNMISIFFVALAGFVCLIAVLIMGDILPAGPLEPATEVPLPTSIGPITATPTDTPEPSATPRDTAEPEASATWTLFPSQTATATATSTATPIPSATATFTETSTPTETPTAIPSATSTPEPLPLPSIVQFNLQTTFVRDAFTHPGCEWQGIAGNITTTTGQPVPNVWIRVVGAGFDQYVLSGTSSSYGTLGGFELQTATAPTAGTYQVQVYAGDQATPLSNPIPVSLNGTCEQTLGVVNFVQATG